MTKLFEDSYANHYHSLNVNKTNLPARYKDVVQSIQKISYEDVQFVIKNQGSILINTLSEKEQECLLPNTVNINQEEEVTEKHF